MKTIKLKKGREKSVRNYHPWIFSGAIDIVDNDITPGSIVKVLDSKSSFLAYAYYNPASQISIRLLEWDEDKLIDSSWWHDKIASSIARRNLLEDDNSTNAYRLIYSECDSLPGLIVDKYNDCIVMQCLTAGIERIKDTLVESLTSLVKPSCIYERGDMESRKMEGIELSNSVLHGMLPSKGIEITENGLRFKVDIESGQKTGYYIDQRDNRKNVAKYAKDNSVLDCFSHTGAFSVYALKSEAKSVTLIDSSVNCLEQARSNLELNDLGIDKADFHTGNALDILRAMKSQGLKFDLVILDPPKFAKNQRHLKKALAGYKDINMLGIELVRPDGYLATFSCSGLVDYDTFKTVLFWASIDTGRRVQKIHDLHQGPDHPRLTTFPEGAYLKGFLCRVE